MGKRKENPNFRILDETTTKETYILIDEKENLQQELESLKNIESLEAIRRKHEINIQIEEIDEWFDTH